MAHGRENLETSRAVCLMTCGTAAVDDGGQMKLGPFVVADYGVGPLITQRGSLVLYVVDSGQCPSPF